MANDALERSTLAKVTRRLLPFLFLLYLVCFLDRVNLGFAALQMNRDLGFSPAVYGFGAGIFLLGYVLFEVPSNLIRVRVGARVSRAPPAASTPDWWRSRHWPVRFWRYSSAVPAYCAPGYPLSHDRWRRGTGSVSWCNGSGRYSRTVGEPRHPATYSEPTDKVVPPA